MKSMASFSLELLRVAMRAQQLAKETALLLHSTLGARIVVASCGVYVQEYGAWYGLLPAHLGATGGAVGAMLARRETEC